MMYRFSSFVLALLLLVASGQAMAVAYFSNNATLTNLDLATPITVKWSTSSDGTCTGTLTATSGAIVVTATDTFTICSGHTLTMGTPITLPLTGASAITVAPATVAPAVAAGTLVATSTPAPIS